MGGAAHRSPEQQRRRSRPWGCGAAGLPALTLALLLAAALATAPCQATLRFPRAPQELRTRGRARAAAAAAVRARQRPARMLAASLPEGVPGSAGSVEVLQSLVQRVQELSARLDARLVDSLGDRLAAVEREVHSAVEKLEELRMRPGGWRPMDASQEASSGGKPEGGGASREREASPDVPAQGGHAEDASATAHEKPSAVRWGGEEQMQQSESSCSSCAFSRITRYHEPLTPPDEPLRDFPNLAKQGAFGPSASLDVGGSGRFYALEALPDRCAGVQHKRYSLRCAVEEAKALGRQLAVHMTTCVAAQHTGRQENIWRPTAAYFDLEQLAESHSVPIVYLEQLIKSMRKKEEDESAQRGRVFSDLSLREAPIETPARQLLTEENSTTVVVRHVNYSQNGFDACHWEQARDDLIQHLNPLEVPFNRHLMGIAEAIVSSLGGRENYTSVHVRRGDKARETQRWPNLDKDTRPERLIVTLPKLVPPHTSIYIATNEEDPRFFDPLKEFYSVHRLQDFSHLWGPGSDWHTTYQELLGSPEPDLDIYMEGIIDDYIVWDAARKVETFNDLTSDPRNGI